MTNCGGLVVIDAHGAIIEWDSVGNELLSTNKTFGDWIETVMSDGDTMMAESA
jgi:hypothetical protein